MQLEAGLEQSTSGIKSNRHLERGNSKDYNSKNIFAEESKSFKSGTKSKHLGKIYLIWEEIQESGKKSAMSGKNANIQYFPFSKMMLPIFSCSKAARKPNIERLNESIDTRGLKTVIYYYFWTNCVRKALLLINNGKLSRAKEKERKQWLK